MSASDSGRDATALRLPAVAELALLLYVVAAPLLANAAWLSGARFYQQLWPHLHSMWHVVAVLPLVFYLTRPCQGNAGLFARLRPPLGSALAATVCAWVMLPLSPMGSESALLEDLQAVGKLVGAAAYYWLLYVRWSERAATA